MSNQSETSRYRELTNKYCYLWEHGPDLMEAPISAGCGIDIASQGDPVVPWAWQLDLPTQEFAFYNSNNQPRGPIQLRGHGDSLPVDSHSLDFVYSSHLLEDYPDWMPVLTEWSRVLKPGGYMIILIPDRERWIAACEAGQPPNDFHRHETRGPEEIASYAERVGCEVVECRFTDLSPGDYTVLAVFRKK